MKKICAIAAAVSMLATSALADAPLAPGKPAGLTKAQDSDDNTVWYVVGVGLLAAGIALAVSNGNDNNGITSGTSGSTSGSTGGTTTTTTTTTKAATTST